MLALVCELHRAAVVASAPPPSVAVACLRRIAGPGQVASPRCKLQQLVGAQAQLFRAAQLPCCSGASLVCRCSRCLLGSSVCRGGYSSFSCLPPQPTPAPPSPRLPLDISTRCYLTAYFRQQNPLSPSPPRQRWLRHHPGHLLHLGLHDRAGGGRGDMPCAHEAAFWAPSSGPHQAAPCYLERLGCPG